MYPLIIYCYDAYCDWCYGFSPIITRLDQEYRDLLNIEVLSGGMILPEQPKPVALLAGYLKTLSDQVSAQTGAWYGTDYLWHLSHPAESDWYPSSEKAAIALCVLKDYYPLLSVQFACALLYALHFEGRDLCDDEAYRHIAEQYGIPAADFYRSLHSDTYRQMALEEFALCRRLGATAFPKLFLQVSDNKLYTLADGYTDYVTIKARIEDILKKETISN
ncbi:MAG: DsbA family protein [Sphingobacteriales bacterium]|nr:DsbA family protein [Sphingobacteriales bacterium]OJY85559.1 MAG: DsbA family protein [Sphingobacteriales bacterium 44-15]